MRVARPTNHLTENAEIYCLGLNFKVIGHFEDHAGFNGIILSDPATSYQLEFTQERGLVQSIDPHPENLLVFYIPDHKEWSDKCKTVESVGFKPVRAHNPYWDVHGKTYADLDGYRLVMQNTDPPGIK